jgi:hypothetical protein
MVCISLVSVRYTFVYNFSFICLLPFCLLFSVLSSSCASSFVFCFFLCFSLLWYWVLASIVAEFLSCFWTSDRNSVHRLEVTLTYTHCRELMKSVGKLLIEMLLSHMLLLMVPEQGRDFHCHSYC